MGIATLLFSVPPKNVPLAKGIEIQNRFFFLGPLHKHSHVSAREEEDVSHHNSIGPGN